MIEFVNSNDFMLLLVCVCVCYLWEMLQQLSRPTRILQIDSKYKRGR